MIPRKDRSSARLRREPGGASQSHELVSCLAGFEETLPSMPSSFPSISLSHSIVSFSLVLATESDRSGSWRLGAYSLS